MRALIQEHAMEKMERRDGIIAVFVLGEVSFQRTHSQFSLKLIHLVEQKLDRGVGKPRHSGNRNEMLQCLFQWTFRYSFEVAVVVLGYGHNEENGPHAGKAVHPF